MKEVCVCQCVCVKKCKVKLIFLDAYRLSRTVIAERLDVGYNLKQFGVLTRLTLTLTPRFYATGTERHVVPMAAMTMVKRHSTGQL